MDREDIHKLTVCIVTFYEIVFGYVLFMLNIFKYKNIKECFKASLPMFITLVGYIVYCITENAWIRRIVMAYIIYTCIRKLVQIGEEKEQEKNE